MEKLFLLLTLSVRISRLPRFADGWPAVHRKPAASTLVDSDNDGVPDRWEIKYFGNLDQTASGDGLTNFQE